jgi:hypothetical protein
MKRKVKIELVVHINAVDEAGVVSSQPASATFEAEVDWIPLGPGYTVTGIVPNGLDEIFLQDDESGRWHRQLLR